MENNESRRSKNSFSNILRNKRHVILIAVLSVFVGIFSGAICALFGRTLLYLDSLRVANPFRFIPFLAVAGVFIVFAYNTFGKDAKGGMSLIFDTAFGKNSYIPVKMIPFPLISTWISNFFGASVGREGVAVQIGANIGFQLSRPFKNPLVTKTLVIAGIAGGFGGLFRTPIAAVFFAIEVLVAGELIFDALIPALISAHVAAFVSGHFGVHAESIPLTLSVPFSAENIARIICAALLFALAGELFSFLTHFFHTKLPELIKNSYVRIFATGICVSALSLILYQGRYSGLSLAINHSVFSGGTVYAWDWIIKLLFTVICLSAGFQGGDLTPLFCIGASFCYVISGILGLPPVFCAALGYAAVFGSATNTFLTPIAIAGEIFGFQNMHYFFIVCAIAYTCNGNRTIYSRQQSISADFLKLK
jgi:H+/Cl- antiporter ClcA